MQQGSKTIATLLEDINTVLENGIAEPNKEIVEEFGKHISDILLTRLQEWSQPRVPTLRLSELGKQDTYIWYKMHGYKAEPLDAATRLKFTYGDIIEQLVLTFAKLAGHSVSNEQEEVELEGIKGHIDAIIDGELVDVKSAASHSYEKFANGTLYERDNFGYVHQIASYATSLDKRRGYLLAVDKQFGNTCLLEVPEERFPNVRERASFVKNMVLDNTPPEPVVTYKAEDNGNTYLTAPSSYCPYKQYYLPELRTFLYSTGPRYYTQVIRQPRVPELINGEICYPQAKQSA